MSEPMLMFMHKRIELIAFSVALCLTARVAAADVVAVVSSKSTISTLSKSQITDIFLGKLSRFPDGVIAVPVDQVEGSQARDAFYTKIAGKTPAQIKAYWSKIIFTGRGQPPRVLANDAEIREYVAANPAAIGYIDAALVDASVRIVD